MASIFGKMRDVCFRDRYSYKLFSDVSTVRYAPDILFSYPMPKVDVKEKQIFVSVIDCAGRDESHNLSEFDGRYVTNMANMLRGYLNDGYDLVMASFCKEEGDESGIAKILSDMGCENHPGIRVLCYNGTNADELTTAIAESGLVIATRFHATILAMAAGRPVLPIVYSDKTKYVLDDLNYSGAIYDLRKDSSLLLGDLFESTIAIDHNYGHFNKLDQILK
jgi:colanic acid/amylovoran biosynthesis protein